MTHEARTVMSPGLWGACFERCALISERGASPSTRSQTLWIPGSGTRSPARSSARCCLSSSLQDRCEAIFEVPTPAKPGYVVEGVRRSRRDRRAPPRPSPKRCPIGARCCPRPTSPTARRSPSRCQQCHDLSKGGPNKIGPNLWDMVDRPRASHPGFDYSSAMVPSHDPWILRQAVRLSEIAGRHGARTRR